MLIEVKDGTNALLRIHQMAFGVIISLSSPPITGLNMSRVM